MSYNDAMSSNPNRVFTVIDELNKLENPDKFDKPPAPTRKEVIEWRKQNG